jgi:hypothetical protein
VTGLGRFAYETWRRERGSQGPARWHALPPEAQRAWNATAEAVTAAERERAAAEHGNDDHFVIFAEGGWITEHPPGCRTPACRWHHALAEVAGSGPPASGRWRITGIDSEGLLSLEPAEMEAPP